MRIIQVVALNMFNQISKNKNASVNLEGALQKALQVHKN